MSSRDDKISSYQNEKKVSISQEDPTVITIEGIINEPSKLVYVAAFVCLLGALALGVVLGYSSPVSEPIFGKDDDASSWFGSIATLGALFGGLFAPYLVKFLGKKGAIILYSIPFTLGWTLIRFGDVGDRQIMFVGRFLTGFCGGLVSGTAPAYINEISHVSQRGMLGSGFQLFVTLGILLTSIFGNLMDWKSFTMICAVPPIVFAVLMIPMPESPVQILKSGGLTTDTIEKVRKELRKLRTIHSNIENELEEIVSSERMHAISQNDAFFDNIKDVNFYKPFVYALSLMFFQQMSGVNAILFYTNSIFQSASENINITLASISLCASQTAATFIESLIVEKVGRRLLLVLSGCGCSVGLGLMGLYYLMKDVNPAVLSSYNWLPLLSLIIFIVSFSIGFAPIPWMMIPELTSSKYRGFITSVSTSFSWSIAFLVTKYFKSLGKIITIYGCYFSFTAFTIFGTIFILIFLPETSGKSFEEIRRRYELSWKNSIFVPNSESNEVITMATSKINLNANDELERTII